MSQNNKEIAQMLKLAFNGMEASKAVETYLIDKLERHLVHVDLITEIRAVLHQNVAHRGKDKDFRIALTLYVPKKVLRIEEEGDDMYAMIDIATEKLARILNKYHDKLRTRSKQRFHKRILGKLPFVNFD